MRTRGLSITAAAALLVAANVYADGNIRGSVFSKNNAEPLDFVSVQLVNPESGKPLAIGTMTDEQGAFLIEQAPAGRYIIRFSMVGSVTQEREIEVADTDINVGRIDLADDTKLLQEVVVTSEKSQMSFGSDRRVFNVSSNISSAGASAAELLAAVPSVDVNSDGEISLRGNDDVLVRIDGKEMGMTAANRAQILRQIPAESIESIEVMTNPSARHSTEGTAGIINIHLKQDHRHGYFGSAEADVDSRGSANLNLNINYNEGKFQSFAGLGLKTHHAPGGMTSERSYQHNLFLNSEGDYKKHENSIFLRLGTSYKPTESNTFYISAIGTLGHKWGHSLTSHQSNLPTQWISNVTDSHESGNTRGANVMLGYRHLFSADSQLDMNVSYNVWQGPNDNRFREDELWADGREETLWQSQHQDVTISNWEAELDYTTGLLPWLALEAGYKGNYNHENSPASYSSGPSADEQLPLNDLYNRFHYDTDITALYLNFSGDYRALTFSAGVRGEAWQIRTRSLAYDQTDKDVPLFKKNDFALFPSLAIGWKFLPDNELKLNYSRRINRPYGPQLNTFENISDPAEVHLGNPRIMPEYSNAVELAYLRNWEGHSLSVAGYFRSNNDMISHVSFLAPMASDESVNTMYYGHANVGNMTNTGVEIISRNTLFSRLTLTTTLNLYNSHLKAWSTDYPLHDDFYAVSGNRQDRFVWDVRCMAAVKLPLDFSLQATGRYSSRRVTAQGTLEADWDVEAGLRKSLGAWDLSVVCKDIFNSKKTCNILYGNGYTQSISKWTDGRTLRLSVAFNFGRTHTDMHDHDHDHDDHTPDTDHVPHNHINTGGYGEPHSHSH